MKYLYHVAYTYQAKSGSGTGSITFSFTKPIRVQGQIKGMQDWLLKDKPGMLSVIITGWELLRKTGRLPHA